MWIKCNENDDVAEGSREYEKNRNRILGWGEKSGSFLTYRNRITKMVFTLAITQHTANVKFRRIIVISRCRFLHDGQFNVHKNGKMQ